MALFTEPADFTTTRDASFNPTRAQTPGVSKYESVSKGTVAFGGRSVSNNHGAKNFDASAMTSFGIYETVSNE